MGNNGYSALPYKLLYTILSPPCYLPPPTSNCLSPIGESQDPRVWYCTRCMMPDRKGDDGPASIFSSPFFPLSILRFSAGGAAHRLRSVHRAQRCDQSSIRYHDMGYAHASAFKLAVFCPLPSALLFPLRESIFAPRSGTNSHYADVNANLRTGPR